MTYKNTGKKKESNSRLRHSSIVFSVLNIKISTFILLFTCGKLAYASCLSDYDKIIKQRYPRDSTQAHVSYCKIWPATGHIILATSIKNVDTTDLEILVLDSKTGKVIAETQEIDALDYGAIFSDRLIIDTAHYRLNASLLAFGIRISWRGFSQPNPYSAETLNLYIVKDSKLIKVLNGLSVYESTGEWDLMCKGKFITTNTLVHMRHLQKGYSHMLLKKTFERSESQMTNNGCETTIAPSKSERYTLYFENDKYTVPRDLSSHISSSE